MAQFSIHFRHHDLWLFDDGELGVVETSFSLEDGTVARAGIGPIRSVLSIDHDVSEELLFGIWSSLKDHDKYGAGEGQNCPPDFTNLPGEYHELALEISEKLIEAGRVFDGALRRTPKGIRMHLPQYGRFRVGRSNQFRDHFAWVFDENDKMMISTRAGKSFSLEGYGSKHLRIPLPPAMAEKHVNLSQTEAESAFSNVPTRSSAYLELFASAKEIISRRGSTAAGVISLCASIETALKDYLSARSDNTAGFLLEKSPSPPITKLLKFAVEEHDLGTPPTFNKWLGELVEARNKMAHSSDESNPSILQTGRWFALGEATLLAVLGFKPHQRIGEVVEPFDPKPSQFAESARAVIVRQEMHPSGSGQRFHLLQDTGMIYYAEEGQIRKANSQKV